MFVLLFGQSSSLPSNILQLEKKIHSPLLEVFFFYVWCLASHTEAT
jgi:hypothetical protein